MMLCSKLHCQKFLKWRSFSYTILRPLSALCAVGSDGTPPLSESEGCPRSFAAIRKDTGLCCGSRLRKGEVFAYVGLSQNLKDLKDPLRDACGRT
jgi:hypothetical protein